MITNSCKKNVGKVAIRQQFYSKYIAWYKQYFLRLYKELHTFLGEPESKVISIQSIGELNTTTDGVSIHISKACQIHDFSSLKTLFAVTKRKWKDRSLPILPPSKSFITRPPSGNGSNSFPELCYFQV